MTHDLVYKGMNGFNQVGYLFYNICVFARCPATPYEPDDARYGMDRMEFDYAQYPAMTFRFLLLHCYDLIRSIYSFSSDTCVILTIIYFTLYVC
jgi:hypothetical protein